MATLADFAKKVRNTKNRQSSAFLRTEALDTGTSYAIDGVDPSNNVLEIASDVTADGEFDAGDKIFVDNSSDLDGVYTVASTASDGGSGTDITVEENVPSGATADGDIYVDKDYTYVNMGRIMDASFNAEPVASDADQDGRESSQLFDITVSFTLMQASNEELSQLSELAMPDDGDYEFYLNGHTLYFSGTNQVLTSDVNNAVLDTDDDSTDGDLDFGTGGSQLDDEDGILFTNVLLKPSAEISLDGETALIPIEFNGRVALDEFEDLDTTQAINISPE